MLLKNSTKNNMFLFNAIIYITKISHYKKVNKEMIIQKFFIIELIFSNSLYHNYIDLNENLKDNSIKNIFFYLSRIQKINIKNKLL